MWEYLTLHPIDIIARNCKFTEQSAIYFETALTDNPFGLCKISKLDISKNDFGKGIKILASALARNASIVHLDLSQCNLGVAGMKALAGNLKNNTTMKWLNLYRNLIDVDGARSLADCLRINKTLEFIDVGFNRIRDTGVKAIADAISENFESQVCRLALRANFITDTGMEYLFNKLVSIEVPRLSHLFIRQNLWNEHAKIDLHRRLKNQVHLLSADDDDFEIISPNKLTFSEEWKAPKVSISPESLVLHEQQQIYVDEFENIDLLEDSVLKRSVWVSPNDPNQSSA